jgi:type IV pilus assembly protein PilQ
LEESLKKFVSETGSVKGDNGSNTLIVTDVPDNLRKVGQLVEQLDRKPFQVLIESHVVDLKVSGSIDYGIDWSLVNYDNPRSYADVSTAPELSSWGEVRFGIIRSRYDFDNIIRAIQENSDAKILSSPRIVALNHKEAQIHVGQEVPYTTVSRTEEGVTYSTEFRKVGTLLDVTPHVTNDGNVLLQLHPEQSFVTEFVENVPVIDTRSAHTEMLLSSGQTAVIGGLKKSDYVISERGIPFLSKIPILGLLFRGQTTTRTDIELMVFVTPHILQGQEIVVQEQTPFATDNDNAAFRDLSQEYLELDTRALVTPSIGAEVIE